MTPKLDAFAEVISQLAELSEPTSRDDERLIRRRHVFSLADGDSVALFFGAMVWGWGLVGYGPTRVANIVDQAGEAFQPKLEALVAAARLGPAEARDALSYRHRIARLGPAFATKVAYFAAGYEDSGHPKPLISDANTSWAMWDLVGLARSVSQKSAYLTYVEFANYWAAHGGWRADEVEWALFEIGKRH